jgi:hypothetical protein
VDDYLHDFGGATNVPGKQAINLMACGRLAFFLEHSSIELRLENSDNLLEKLVDCKRRLLVSFRKPIYGFSLAVPDAIALDDDDELLLMLGTLDKHFKNSQMFSFCSDSPSVMTALRRMCRESEEFTFTMGCTPHALQKFLLGLGKAVPRPEAHLEEDRPHIQRHRRGSPGCRPFRQYMPMKIRQVVCPNPVHENSMGNGLFRGATRISRQAGLRLAAW